MGRVYFDNAATTPMDPRVIDEMTRCCSVLIGNPSSLHTDGREARAAVDAARARVAALFGAKSEEIIFTASGTEADNLGLFGVVSATKAKHIITSSIEHPAVMETCRILKEVGTQVTYLPVGADGIVDPSALEAAIRPDTRLVSIMAANNVVGTLQRIEELGTICRQHDIYFHTDAVQLCGKAVIDLRSLPIDLLSFSAHKLYGPKGVGGLYVREGARIDPIMYGGGHEGGLRPATENVAGICGTGAAFELARKSMAEDAARLVTLREKILEDVLGMCPEAYLIGHRFRRLPGFLSFGFSGYENEAITFLLEMDKKGVSLSSGSACSAKNRGAPSHVLTAMGFDPIRARGVIRLSLGRFNTDEEVGYFIEVLPDVLSKLRKITSRPFGFPERSTQQASYKKDAATINT